MNSWKTLQDDHGMKDLQLVIAETFKQDPSRHQVWNIDKLYKIRNMFIKKEKKQHMWDKCAKHTSLSYISNKYNVCKNVTRSRYM